MGSKTIFLIVLSLTILFANAKSEAYYGSDFTSYSDNSLITEMPPCSPNSLPWTRIIDKGSYTNDGIAVRTDNCGNVLVAGNSQTNTGNISNSDFMVVKYNSTGDTLWISTYNGSDSINNREDKVTAMETDNLGNIYVTGTSFGSTSDLDFLTVKFNSDGVLQWAKKFKGPSNYFDVPLSVAVDNNSNVFVTGYSRPQGLSPAWVTIKYNATGDSLWQKYYYGDAGDASVPYVVGTDAANNIYVTGYSFMFGQGADIVTIKYNTSGTQIWKKRYNGPAGPGTDIPYSMKVTSSGTLYIAGQSDSVSFNSDYVVLKYDSSGVQQWVGRHNGSGNQNDYASAVAVDLSGNVYITGYVTGLGSSYDLLTVRYSSSGAKQWVQSYNGSNNYHDLGRSIVCDISGNIYVAGYTNVTGGYYDAVVIKYNSSGVQKGFRTYNGTGNRDDYFMNIAIDTLGNIIATGSSNNTIRNLMLTKKFPQSEFGNTLKLTAILEGFHYSSSTPFMRSDTVRVYLRTSSAPYNIVDSSKQILNNVGIGEFFFTNVSQGVNYFLTVKHRNSIETWSANGNWIVFNSDTTSYNFTTSASKAFGSNIRQINISPLRFAFYGGDTNQDGTVDASDLSEIDNDAIYFITGYVETDLTGDGFVDGSDFAIADNNAAGFVSVARP